MKLRMKVVLAVCLMCLAVLLSACDTVQEQIQNVTGNGNESTINDSQVPTSSRDATPVVYQPSADGVNVYNGKVSVMDLSNTSKGYIMVKYTGTNQSVKVQLRHENSDWYTYDLNSSGEYEVFPITTGNGSYTITINENIEGTRYAQIDATTFSVQLENDYIAFLHPNQYVDYSESSLIVAETEKIATGAQDDLDVVTKVYEHVIENVEYDFHKADNIEEFYLPDVDKTFSSKEGICFDYAALMTAMLRTQNIPTQLVIGYAGTAYHAWISVYTPETGWIDNMIEFNGKEWVRLDPTFASTSNSNPDILEYVGDGQNYNAMYFY